MSVLQRHKFKPRYIYPDERTSRCCLFLNINTVHQIEASYATFESTVINTVNPALTYILESNIKNISAAIIEYELAYNPAAFFLVNPISMSTLHTYNHNFGSLQHLEFIIKKIRELYDKFEFTINGINESIYSSHTLRYHHKKSKLIYSSGYTPINIDDLCLCGDISVVDLNRIVESKSYKFLYNNITRSYLRELMKPLTHMYDTSEDWVSIAGVFYITLVSGAY
jgi:hypothetical protein